MLDLTPNHQANSGRHDEPLLLRAEEVARLTSLGRSTIFNLLASGELPAVRIGRAVRVRRSDLESWIEARAGQ